MNIDEDEDEDEERKKAKAERAHRERVKEQMIAEEEGLKSVKIVRGVDKTVYKNRKYKYVPPPKKEMPDKEKLKVMRSYQFFTALIGISGVGVIFFAINQPVFLLPIFEDLVIRINLILLGCVLALASIVGIISFQYRHDKISDRISSGHYIT